MKNDLELKKDIEEEIQWEPSVNAAEIGVEVTDGVVTLHGRVDSAASKEAAESAAKRLSGVRALANEIKVGFTGFGEICNTDIARAAERALESEAYLPDDRIKVTVDGGWITLEGEVDRQFEKDLARQAVLYLKGVKGVTNRITLNLKMEPAEMDERFEAVLSPVARVEA
ncbi:MAG: BON domain-containing protein [Acidobacteria bacterium]|nr:BON domain-containing protein [Acidobacteriota bacterium]